QIGFVMKLHHALADGMASVSLIVNAFALDEADVITEPFVPEPEPTRQALYRAAAGSLTEGLRSVPSVTRETVAGLRNQRVVRRAESTRVVGPFAGPRTPFNVSLVPERTFAMFSFPLESITPARRSVGASVNDAFLALCAGGIRRYLSRSDELPSVSLVASVPIGTPDDQPRLGGNHVDNLYVSLHTDVADPLERLQAIHDSVRAARHVRGAPGTGLFERRASIMPPILQSVAARSWAATGLAGRIRPPLNIVASSVPGPRTPLEIKGGRVTALYSSGPILEGIGLNITVWSYIDTMYVSLLGCPTSLPDPWLLAADMEDERRALAAAAAAAPSAGC
ncbi:MAG: WS/DGAT domain-containing protein, partial [Aquihabitans sp.]